MNRIVSLSGHSRLCRRWANKNRIEGLKTGMSAVSCSRIQEAAGGHGKRDENGAGKFQELDRTRAKAV